MNEFSKDTISRLQNCGALGYDSKTIALICGIEVQEVDLSIKSKSGNIYEEITRGMVLHNYKCESKLMEMAHAGDIKAMGELDRRKKQRR